mgnify:CR=1 FL=1
MVDYHTINYYHNPSDVATQKAARDTSNNFRNTDDRDRDNVICAVIFVSLAEEQRLLLFGDLIHPNVT